MRILIDAGHGIDTPGKRSPDGSFLEYKWNREIAELVFSLLEELGFDVDFVVTETNDIPLKTRVRRVNEVSSLIGSHNVLLLSIHSNAVGSRVDESVDYVRLYHLVDDKIHARSTGLVTQ